MVKCPKCKHEFFLTLEEAKKALDESYRRNDMDIFLKKVNQWEKLHPNLCFLCGKPFDDEFLGMHQECRDKIMSGNYNDKDIEELRKRFELD